MTVKEFVAEINSKCKDLSAGLNNRGMVIRRKDGKSAVCIYHHPNLGLNAYGIMRREDGRACYLDRKAIQQIVEKLKEAIGYNERTI